MPGLFPSAQCAPRPCPTNTSSACPISARRVARAGFVAAETLIVVVLVAVIIAAAVMFNADTLDGRAMNDLDDPDPTANLVSESISDMVLADGAKHAFSLGIQGQLTKRDPAGMSPPESIPFLEGRPTAIAYLPRKKLLVVGTEEGDLVPLDSVSCKPVTDSASWRLDGGIACCAVSADGRRFAAASNCGCIGVWDVQTGRGILHCTPLEGDAVAASDIALSASGDRVSVSLGQVAICLDVARGTELSRVGPFDVTVRCVALSRDGRQAALGTVTGNVVCWETETGTQLWNLDGSLAVRRIHFSPGADLLAYACGGKVVRIVYADSGLPHQQWIGGLRHVKALIWDDSGTLYSAGFEGEIRWWNLKEPGANRARKRVAAAGAGGR